jgi:glycosyltransferase involved in cell wall biosynthesis
MDCKPFFSICIPTFNRREYLAELLLNIDAQNFPKEKLEIVVVDDASTDDTASVIPAILIKLFPHHQWKRNDRNLGFDGNLRASLSLGTGRYLICMGSDEIFTSKTVLNDIRHILNEHEKTGRSIGVLVPNYVKAGSGLVERYFINDVYLEPSPQLPAEHFRKFGFVSGLVFNSGMLQPFLKGGIDGTCHLQIYWGCSVVSRTGGLYGWSRYAVLKDIVLEGSQSAVTEGMSVHSENYGKYYRNYNFIPLVLDALPETLPISEKKVVRRKVFWMLISRNFPFYVFLAKEKHWPRHPLRYFLSIAPVFFKQMQATALEKTGAWLATFFWGIVFAFIPIGICRYIVQADWIRKFRKYK